MMAAACCPNTTELRLIAAERDQILLSQLLMQHNQYLRAMGEQAVEGADGPNHNEKRTSSWLIGSLLSL
jgi:hypothetical protein